MSSFKITRRTHTTHMHTCRDDHTHGCAHKNMDMHKISHAHKHVHTNTYTQTRTHMHKCVDITSKHDMISSLTRDMLMAVHLNTSRGYNKNLLLPTFLK